MGHNWMYCAAGMDPIAGLIRPLLERRKKYTNMFGEKALSGGFL